MSRYFVLVFLTCEWQDSEQGSARCFWDSSSIYQDISLYSVEEFKTLAPAESRTDEVLANEHQLMLTRLNFELTERQRFAGFHMFCRTQCLTFPCRLDLRKKELTQQKEMLLRESKLKAATMDNVKSQLDMLMKASAHNFSRRTCPPLSAQLDRWGDSEESRRTRSHTTCEREYGVTHIRLMPPVF